MLAHNSAVRDRAAASSAARETASSARSNALVVEDTRMACAMLRLRTYDCERTSHNELMSAIGSKYVGTLIDGNYNQLWFTALPIGPSDFRVNVPDHVGRVFRTYCLRLRS